MNLEETMHTILIYDKPMCCSSGVCGPQVDPALAHFAADLDWLKTQGHRVERFNLAQQPGAFAENADVRQILAAEGADCLPLIMVDGVVTSRGQYPSRDKLAMWAGATPRELLPVMGDSGKCCGGSGCC
jgi:arsenite methyltransferase